MGRQKSSRKNLGRKNNGQSYFCKFCNVSVTKIHRHEQSRKHINAIQKHSQNDNLSPNTFNLREICVRTTNSQTFESENICTEISPKYQSNNEETMSIKRLSESNHSFKEPENDENIEHKNETNNSTYLSIDDKLTRAESTNNNSVINNFFQLK